MDEFQTSEGVPIPLRHVSQLYVERIYAKHPMPEVPTYEAELVGGGKQTFQLDRESLTTPEEKAAWAEYEDLKEKAIAARLKETAEFLLYHCIDMEPRPVEEWSVDFDLWDFEKPDPADKRAFKLAWIEMELLTDPDDYAAIMAKLYAMGGLLQDEKVKEFEEFFRLTLGRL